MILVPDASLRFRVLDLETTGASANDHVVEIAAVDLIGLDIIPIGSHLVTPLVPISPEASAVHHLTDSDVVGAPDLEALLPVYMDIDRVADVDVFVAHNWAFEAQWLGEHLRGRPAICTYKAAIRVWPEAPGHSNQTLRYWLKPEGLSSSIATPPHRPLPDALVTAHILRELLRVATVEELITWTDEPALLPRVTFGRHRGCSWSEVPTDYLAWVVERSELGHDIKFTAEHHRGRT
ncbi:MAG TPA: exonuclease domain-containing protein [Microvirga sp.]|jgi:exodeoxyribonuclease X|nr:exonuclease domain-containing protein [Microvirga sp.]